MVLNPGILDQTVFQNHVNRLTLTLGLKTLARLYHTPLPTLPIPACVANELTNLFPLAIIRVNQGLYSRAATMGIKSLKG